MCDIPQLPCCVTYSIPNSASNLSNIHEVVYEVPDYTATIAVGRCCYLYRKPLRPFVWEGARANTIDNIIKGTHAHCPLHKK